MRDSYVLATFIRIPFVNGFAKIALSISGIRRQILESSPVISSRSGRLNVSQLPKGMMIDLTY